MYKYWFFKQKFMKLCFFPHKKTYNFLADKGFAPSPPPLTYMSAKNVSFYGWLP